METNVEGNIPHASSPVSKTTNKGGKKHDAPPLIDVNLLSDDNLRRFLSDLIDRHRFHTNLAKDLNVRYKWLSPILLLFIPMYSAVLSFLATGVVESKASLSLLALVLTVATILNSTLRPDEKFVSSANVLVQLKDWEADLALGLSELHNGDPKLLMNFLRDKNSKLSEIGSSMARTYLPMKNT